MDDPSRSNTIATTRLTIFYPGWLISIHANRVIAGILRRSRPISIGTGVAFTRFAEPVAAMHCGTPGSFARPANDSMRCDLL
jgi:hypothetical protein